MNKIKNHTKSNNNDEKSEVEAKIDKQKKELINKIAKYCSKCGTAYQTDDVQLINTDAHQFVIHFKCSKCSTDYIANYSPPGGVISKVPINTDLKPEEFPKFLKTGEIVTSDDVVRVYDFLNEKNNN